MKPNQNSLERLFRSAAQATRQIPGEAPFAVEARVLANFRRGPETGDQLFSYLPLFRRGLALACLAAVVVVAISYVEQQPVVDETTVLNSVAEVTYLP